MWHRWSYLGFIWLVLFVHLWSWVFKFCGCSAWVISYWKILLKIGLCNSSSNKILGITFRWNICLVISNEIFKSYVIKSTRADLALKFYLKFHIKIWTLGFIARVTTIDHWPKDVDVNNYRSPWIHVKYQNSLFITLMAPPPIQCTGTWCTCNILVVYFFNP